MRICFVSLMNGMQWGGSEELWYSTALKSLSNNDSVMVSVYDWGSLHSKVLDLKKRGAKIHLRERYNPQQRFLGKIWKVTKRYLNLNIEYKAIIDYAPDHVIISQGDNFDLVVHHFELYSLISRSKISYSIICHSHAQFSYIPESNIYPRGKEVFNNARNIFFVSKKMQKTTERILCSKLLNAKTTWNPLNLVNFKSIPWPQSNCINFAVVGSLISSKGQDMILEVLAEDKWRNLEWHLNFYGNGYGEHYLKNLTDYFTLSDRVTFHGHVSDIRSIWAINQILLIPSAGEGLPISLVEAMICGRPAVVTDVGGNTELIVEDETGYVAESPSTISFSKALEKAWYNKNAWEQLGNNARCMVLDNVDLNPESTLYNTIFKNE